MSAVAENEAAGKLAEAVAVLRTLEWAGNLAGGMNALMPVCPVCRASPRDGHSRKGCKLL